MLRQTFIKRRAQKLKYWRNLSIIVVSTGFLVEVSFSKHFFTSKTIFPICSNACGRIFSQIVTKMFQNAQEKYFSVIFCLMSNSFMAILNILPQQDVLRIIFSQKENWYQTLAFYLKREEVDLQNLTNRETLNYLSVSR